MPNEPVPMPPQWDPFRLPVLALLNDAPLRAEECEAECFQLGSRMGILFDAVRHPEMRTPVAAMVSGGWGTGKTSSMRWLDQQLKLWKSGVTQEQIAVDTCWFVPWKYQSAEDVWKGLIAEVILATLGTGDQDVGKIVKAAKQFGMFLGSGFVRLLGASTLKMGDARTMGIEGKLDVKEALSGIIEEYGKHVTPEKAYYNAFEKALKDWIEETYHKNRRLVIFIDDLDRCMPDIALQVLEALKLYLNIENLIFIVGVDKSVIEGIVAQRYEDMIGKDRMAEQLEDDHTFADKAAQYLDRMFQIEVNVQPTEPQVDGFLEQRLESVSWWKDIPAEQQRYLLFALKRSARHNPRSVVRKINQILVAAGGDSDATRRVQAIQAVLLAEACSQKKTSAWRTREGFRFFYAWSQALLHIKENFLPAGQDFELKAGERDEEDRFRPLRDVARDFPDLAHLLRVESIGLLMRLPYPSPSLASSLIEGVSGVDRDPDWVSILRPIVSQATGRTLEEVDEEFITKLTELDLSGTAVTDARLTNIEKLTELTKLDLSGTAVTDAGFEHLEKMVKLTELNLFGTAVTDAGLIHLEKLTDLTVLNLCETVVTDNGLAHLEKLTKLVELDLSGIAATVVGLAHLENLTKLTSLRIYGKAVKDAGLAHLEKLTKLTSLALCDTDITETGIGHLEGLTSLTHLNLSETVLEDAWLSQLVNMTGLTYLNLFGTGISDAGAIHLEKLINLRVLITQNVDLSPETIHRLKKALPKCTIYF